jgi:hypothetical protein
MVTLLAMIPTVLRVSTEQVPHRPRTFACRVERWRNVTRLQDKQYDGWQLQTGHVK